MFISKHITEYIFTFLTDEYRQLFREVDKSYAQFFRHRQINWKLFALGHSVALCKRYKIKINTRTLYKAAGQGNLEVMTWLLDNNCQNKVCHSKKPRIKKLVFKMRDPSVERKCRWTRLTLANAALNGNLENIKWLHERHYPMKKKTFQFAVKKGDIDNLRWLLDNGCPSDSVGTYCYAALYGNITVLQWLKDNNIMLPDDSENLINIAIDRGDLNNIKWFKKNGCNFDFFSFRHAARLGNLNNMKWLQENNCPWNENAFQAAAIKGNLINMKWLFDNGCPWNCLTFSAAADYGNLDNLKWLRENGCPWDKATFTKAAKHGNLENMKWLRENGCPWDSETFQEAAGYGDLTNLRWLLENKCPWDTSTLAYAAGGGCPFIQYLGAPEKNIKPKSAKLENLKWLRENGCPWDYKTLIYAVKDGNIENIRWLVESKCPWKLGEDIKMWMLSDPEVIKWIENNIEYFDNYVSPISPKWLDFQSLHICKKNINSCINRCVNCFRSYIS